MFYFFLAGFCLMDVLFSFLLVLMLRFLFLMFIVTPSLFLGVGRRIV